MYIEFVRWTGQREQRPGDLRIDLEYLLNPKHSEAIGVKHARLAGPLETRGLIQSVAPWAPTVRDAAQDLATQMDKFRRTVFRVQPTPEQWYVKTLISFDPRATELLARPLDGLQVPRINASIHKNSLRIAHDVLDALGCAEDHVGVFAVHTDRPHVHVHGLIVLAQGGGHRWNPFELTDFQLLAVSEVATEVFGHPTVEVSLSAKKALSQR